MAKRVLVVDVDNDRELGDFVFQLFNMTLAEAKTFIENSSLPGELVAEFDEKVDVKHFGFGHHSREIRVVRIPLDYQGTGDNLHVLLLKPATEGEKK